MSVLARAGYPRVRAPHPLPGLPGSPERQSVEQAVLTAADPIAAAVARSATAATERWGGLLEHNDVLQEARLGLVLGVREWDPARGRLDAWLARRAYQTVTDAIRRAGRRQEEYLADRLEEAGDDERSLSEILADPHQDPEEATSPRRRLAAEIARQAHLAGRWAEEALDRLVETHEAGDEPAAQRFRRILAPVVAAAMAATIRANSAAAPRQRRRTAA